MWVHLLVAGVILVACNCMWVHLLVSGVILLTCNCMWVYLLILSYVALLLYFQRSIDKLETVGVTSRPSTVKGLPFLRSATSDPAIKQVSTWLVIGTVSR